MKREPFHDRPPTLPAGSFAARAAICFLAVIFGICSTGHAQLHWDTRSLQFHPSPADATVTAEFHFTNTGKTPIKIKEVKTSCGCTTATPDKKVFGPGEKGKITVVFDIGGRQGVQDKEVYVATSDPKEPELVLQFKVTIPKLLDIDNQTLEWTRGEELKPKIVNIKVLGDYPIHHLDVSTTSSNMVARIRHVEGSRDFQVVVTPKKADGKIVLVEIKPDYPKDQPRREFVYAQADN